MKTYHGSCFCGDIAFEATGDLAQGTMRCNCRFCRKMRYWEMRVDPEAFRVTRGAELMVHTPPSRPQDDEYWMHHHFCPRCGTRLFSEGNIAEMGGRVVQVFVPALDDAGVEELATAPVVYADGANDNWWNAPAETRHL